MDAVTAFVQDASDDFASSENSSGSGNFSEKSASTKENGSNSSAEGEGGGTVPHGRNSATSHADNPIYGSRKASVRSWKMTFCDRMFCSAICCIGLSPAFFFFLTYFAQCFLRTFCLIRVHILGIVDLDKIAHISSLLAYLVHVFHVVFYHMRGTVSAQFFNTFTRMRGRNL